MMTSREQKKSVLNFIPVDKSRAGVKGRGAAAQVILYRCNVVPVEAPLWNQITRLHFSHCAYMRHEAPYLG
jgi:hypothetical protein